MSETELSAPEIASRLLEKGIRMGAINERRMRAVTHLDVSKSDVIAASDAIQEILKNHKA